MATGSKALLNSGLLNLYHKYNDISENIGYTIHRNKIRRQMPRKGKDMMTAIKRNAFLYREQSHDTALNDSQGSDFVCSYKISRKRLPYTAG